MRAIETLASRSGRFGAGLVLVALTSISGCGGSGAPSIGHVYKVSGKVLDKADKPLDGGRIYFVHKDGAITAEGKVGHDGTFTLSTGVDDGAPEGSYKVRVEPADPSLMISANLGKRPGKGGRKLPFAPRYLDEDSSGLIAKVEPRDNQLEPFHLN